jgi:hypothetical protein
MLFGLSRSDRSASNALTALQRSVTIHHQTVGSKAARYPGRCFITEGCVWLVFFAKSFPEITVV